MNAPTTTDSPRMSSMPNFETWSKKALEEFASQAFETMCAQADTVEQLRQDNKDLSKLLREQITKGELNGVI